MKPVAYRVIRDIPAELGYERARLVALKKAGYAVDPTAEPIRSVDRRYNDRVKRSHIDVVDGKRTYRFSVQR